MRKILIVLVLLVIVSTGTLLAGNRVSLHVDYNIPIAQNNLSSNLALGASYRFWGIFRFHGTIYTNVIPGGDNIFGIEAIKPIGLFSGGFGMRIPMGGFSLILDWQRFFTGTLYDEVYNFSHSAVIGVEVELTSVLSVEVYKRTLFDFTDKAETDLGLATAGDEESLGMLGLGFVIHL